MTSTQTSLQGVSEGTFSGSNSLQLFYQSWYPPSLTETTADISAADANPSATAGSPIRGVLALIHGLGEHSGRYCNVVKALTAAGYAVFAFDNQGHGRSEG
ncbi:MAG: alpha/beta fold hydrolase, partial [Phormidesmis sp.]